MATVKNVGLSPINRGDVQKYTAQQSPAFRQEFWDKMEKTNDIDYYLYMLGEADKKGITAQSMNFEGLQGNIDDQWAEFYKNVAASSTEVKDYGEGYGEMTEKDYLTKILDQKREYNAWLIEEAQIKAEKEAMSGWDKFWAGTGHFFVNVGYSMESGLMSIVDFITNYDGGKSLDFIQTWKENQEGRQAQLADWERRYSYRDVETWDTGFGATMVIGAANTLGLMLPAMVANRIKPGAGMWTMYGTIFTQNVFEARQNPELSVTEADILLRATLQTGVEVFVEKALGSSMLDDLVLGTGRASKEFVKVTTWSGIKHLTKEVVQEASEEFFQELGSAMVNMVLSLDNEEWLQYNSETLAKDMGIAALLGGLFSGTRVVGPEIIKGPIKAVQAIKGKTKAGDVIANQIGSVKVTVPGDTKVDTTTKPEVPAKPEQSKIQEYHRMNMFERLAMKINLDSFFKNVNEAKAGNLTSEARQTIYEQAMMLGKIFQGLDAPQILRSMKLLKAVENYAKREGAKQEKIDKLNEGYLQSIVTEVHAIQKDAAIKFYDKKITAKEAAKLAKEARITKAKGVIDQRNVDEKTKTLEETRKKKDVKPKARKTMIKATTTEGKVILPTDGQSLELIEDNILIPEAYLEDGNPMDILRDVVEKDIAQEFVLYMRSAKRLVGWSQAKAALIKGYPEMNDYTDQQIARNILFNKGGAYALVSNLSNSEFNILFLNSIEGIRQVIYKTEVYGAAKQNTLKLVEGNFRYAARMYCLDNLGVNPHDLYNVLQKVDQIFIKDERAKTEAKFNEAVREMGSSSKTDRNEFVLDENHAYQFTDKKGREVTVTSYIEQEGHVTFLIDVSGELIAQWRLDLQRDLVATVDGLLLTPPYQNAGIGTEVLTLMEDYAANNWNVKEMKVKAGTYYEGKMTLDQVIGFYKSRGYVVDKTWDGAKNRLTKYLRAEEIWEYRNRVKEEMVKSGEIDLTKMSKDEIFDLKYNMNNPINLKIDAEYLALHKVEAEDINVLEDGGKENISFEDKKRITEISEELNKLNPWIDKWYQYATDEDNDGAAFKNTKKTDNIKEKFIEAITPHQKELMLEAFYLQFGKTQGLTYEEFLETPIGFARVQNVKGSPKVFGSAVPVIGNLATDLKAQEDLTWIMGVFSTDGLIEGEDYTSYVFEGKIKPKDILGNMVSYENEILLPPEVFEKLTPRIAYLTESEKPDREFDFNIYGPKQQFDNSKEKSFETLSEKHFLPLISENKIIKELLTKDAEVNKEGEIQEPYNEIVDSGANYDKGIMEIYDAYNQIGEKDWRLDTTKEKVYNMITPSIKRRMLKHLYNDLFLDNSAMGFKKPSFKFNDFLESNILIGRVQYNGASNLDNKILASFDIIERTPEIAYDQMIYRVNQLLGEKSEEKANRDPNNFYLIGETKVKDLVGAFGIYEVLADPKKTTIVKVFKIAENVVVGSFDVKQQFDSWDLRPEGASFTTPEYGRETYGMFQGILRKSLTTMEQANTSLKEVINNPEMYLKQGVIDAIIEKYGDTSKDSVYRFLRTLFIDETDGTKTITQSENGDSYYFADVTPVKKWNTAGITKVANKDPDGRSLFDTYKGQTVNASEFWKGEALVGKAGNVIIEFTEKDGISYSANQNKIFFDTNFKDVKNNREFLFALNHEFQHALQSTNRTAGGFATGLIIPPELVAAVKAEFPKEFKANMTPVQEMVRANQVIYKYSGEMEANQHATDYDFRQFVIAVKGDKYAVFTPEGKGPFYIGFEKINRVQKGAPDLTSHKELKRIRKVPKYKAEQSNLKYLTKKGKSIRIHPDLQTFIIEASNLNMLEEDVANMIKDASITYQKLMKWFKETPNINNYTFKHMQQSFWPNSPITDFETLMKVTSGITFDLDEKGNFKEVKFRFKGEEFTINDDAYRVAVMDHWTEGTDMNTIRKLVGATEILRRTISFTQLTEGAKKRTDGEIDDIQLGVTEDFVDALLNNSTRAKKEQALRGFVTKQIAAKAIEGKMTYDEAKKILNKYSIEFFEDLSDNDLDRMYVKWVLEKEGAKVKEEVINKALERNRKNAIANIKRLGTTIWNNTTVKNRKRLPADTFLLFTEEGKIRQEAYKGKSQVDILRLENLLRDTAMKARRGDYSSDETQKAYESLKKTKKQVEKLKGKAKTQVVNTTKVVTEYVTQVKTEAKIIEVKTTKANTPIKLEQLLATNFTKKRMSQMQEMENSEYHVSAKEEFRTQNQTLLDSITEAEWIDIVEWFEQSEFVGTEIDLGNFKAIRMYILADLVSRIKTHNIVMSNSWVNRINNLLSKNVHSSAVEMATWSKVLNTINPYRQLAQEYNVSEEALDDIQSALESDNDEQLAKAIDQVKKEIADNYVEKNMMEKLLAFRYTAMLSSPMTWFRNLVSNFIVKHFNKWSAGIGEKLMGKKMSKYKGYKLVGTKVTPEIAEFIKLNLLDSGLLHQLTEGYSKYDPYTAETTKKVDKDYIVRTMINNFNKSFEQEMVYGTSKISPLFVKFSEFVRKMISDEKFVNEATLRYFGKMLTEDIAEGRLNPEILYQGMFTKEVVTRFADAQWLAMGDYMKNANFMTKAIGALNENRFARYIMPLVIPFAQSSWNWWVETMRYSPFGLGEAIIRLVRFDQYVERMDKKRSSSKKGQSASVQSSMLDKFMATRDLGKGVVGTFLWTTGIILASAGIIGLSRNADDKYVLKVGNVEVNVDPWFGSSTLLAGAALVGAIKEGKWQDMFNVTIDQMAQTLFITDILSSFKYGGPGKYVTDLPMNVLYSFIPNFIKMLSTNVQVYKVKYDKGILGDLERFATGLVPGLSYAFPHEVDPFTGKKKIHKIPILTQFGGISYNDISQAEREAAIQGLGLGQLTGEITVNGEKVYLNAENVNIYRGEYTNQFIMALINDEVGYNGKRYSRMTKNEKKAALQNAISRAASYAKIKVWTEMGNKYYTGATLYNALKNLGIQKVYQGSGGYIKK